MTSAALVVESTETAVVTQVAACVRDLAALAGGGCLVESRDGRLLAHHLVRTDAAPLVLAALVSGSLAPLHTAVTSRRATGLLPSGVVVQVTLEGEPVLHLALDTGSIWLLPTRELTMEQLRGPAGRLAELLSYSTTSPERSCLDGGPLPPELLGADRYWVARVLADTTADALTCALTTGFATLAMRAVNSGQNVYLIAAAHLSKTTGRNAQMAVEGATQQAARRLGIPVTAGLSAECDAEGLGTARNQADAVADTADIGTCSTLHSARATIVIRHLAASLTSSPDLGPDPLHRLLDYDRERDTSFATSLLAWLNTCGDVGRAASELTLHPNTLRYRLRRITAILGVDLHHHPDVRAVIHLQLLARAR